MLPKTSLGVDISSEKIELALLRQTGDRVKLLKVASEPVPTGAINRGGVEDPILLAKAIKALRNRERISPRRTVVSLFTHPVLTQIINLPENLPSNIAQYVQREVKHCAALPCKNISLDYCGISSSPSSDAKRIFVVAAEKEGVLRLVKALNEAGLNVEAIEPAELACATALYEKKIAGSLDSCVLIALVEGADVTLSVFRNQTLDFIRKRHIAEGICQFGEGLARFAEEISAIIQYYDVEIGGSSQSWRLITVLRQAGQRAEGIAGFLQSKFSDLDVEVLSAETGCENMPLTMSANTERASLVAVGLAMKLLDVPQPKLKINLVPSENVEVNAVKQYALITTIIAAAILTVMILFAGILGAGQNITSKIMTSMREKQSSMDTSPFLIEQESLSKQADSLREKLEKINGILHSGYTGDWSLILDDIRHRTPKSLWITSLVGGNNSRIEIRGQSFSYEAAQLFVDMLAESRYIDSADLVEAEKSGMAGGLVSYSIDCSLAAFEGT